MTSATYQQQRKPGAANSKIDPENRYLWQRPLIRLEAEILRDAMLATTGRLDRKLYGQSEKSFETSRRSLYLTIKRREPHGFFSIFDAPDAIVSAGRRQVSTVSSQSLSMLNSPFARECALQFAERVLRQNDNVDAMIEDSYWIAYSREPTKLERKAAREFIQNQTDIRTKDSQKQSLTDFCQMLLCSNEFLYIN